MEHAVASRSSTKDDLQVEGVYGGIGNGKRSNTDDRANPEEHRRDTLRGEVDSAEPDTKDAYARTIGGWSVVVVVARYVRAGRPGPPDSVRPVGSTKRSVAITLR